MTYSAIRTSIHPDSFLSILWSVPLTKGWYPLENTERVFKAFIDIIGDKPLSDIGLADIEKFKQARKGKVADRDRGGKIRKSPLQQEAIDIVLAVPDTAQWIFTDGKGNRIVEDLATKKFKKYAKDAGLSEDVHFHSAYVCREVD